MYLAIALIIAGWAIPFVWRDTIGTLNFVVLQWFGVRLRRISWIDECIEFPGINDCPDVNKLGHSQIMCSMGHIWRWPGVARWRLVRFVWPLTGWWSPYRWIWRRR